MESMTPPLSGTLYHWAFSQNLGSWILGRVGLRATPSCRILTWCFLEFAKKCLSAIEAASDTIDEAVTEDLALITRYPPGSTRLLVKRSKAKALRKLWDDALKDADQVLSSLNLVI